MPSVLQSLLQRVLSLIMPAPSLLIETTCKKLKQEALKLGSDARSALEGGAQSAAFDFSGAWDLFFELFDTARLLALKCRIWTALKEPQVTAPLTVNAMEWGACLVQLAGQFRSLQRERSGLDGETLIARQNALIERRVQANNLKERLSILERQALLTVRQKIQTDLEKARAAGNGSHKKIEKRIAALLSLLKCHRYALLSEKSHWSRRNNESSDLGESEFAEIAAMREASVREVLIHLNAWKDLYAGLLR